VLGPKGRHVDARINLAGVHQSANAGVATAVLWTLDEHWPGIAHHATQGLETVRWAGRMERLEVGEVTVILDGAHNAAAAEALARSVAPRSDPSRTSLIFGAMSDKPWQPMLSALAPLATRRFYTEPLRPIAGRRAATPGQLARVAPGCWLGDPRTTIHQAIAQALPAETIIVAGSIFLVGAVRAALLGLQEDTILPL
jgi:dihydrofolate synthase/folylpolyglutamate synthase